MPHPLRSAIVDLGSNSVRLVIFEGRGRNPQAVFNEKAVLGLGRGLQATGRLNEAAIGRALPVMARYAAVARAMGADPIEVVATAAARDASNGPEFVAALSERMHGVPIRILSGDEEGRISAEGVLLGFPHADGILGDIGGGSLEVVRVAEGIIGPIASLPLGTIRLAERAGGDVGRARAVAESDLAKLPWAGEGTGRDLYAVGGAFRALAKLHMEQTGYPLSIVHHYVLSRDEARSLTSSLINATPRTLEKLPGISVRRSADLPFAATVLRRLLRATGARRVVFSANGVREGWYSRLLSPAQRSEDPMLAAGRELAGLWARDPALPPELIRWCEPLFADDLGGSGAALHEAACWLSDIGSHDHPDYRAEQAFLRVFRQPGVGLDHPSRAFLALVVALRYDLTADAPCLAPARRLLDAAAIRRAERLGAALRLAYTLSGGTPALLGETTLLLQGGKLVLRLVEGHGVFMGEGVQRRLEALAEALGLSAVVEVA